MSFDAPRIFLIGGTDISLPQPWPADRSWVAAAGCNPICIVDLTTNDAIARRKFHDIMRRYFLAMNRADLVFLSDTAVHETGHIIASSSAIYLPGGDPEVLLTEVRARGLASHIGAATGILVGNSAGAIALCSDAVITADEQYAAPIVRKGVGAVEFSVDPHYDPVHDRQLLALSDGRTIFGVPTHSSVVVSAAGCVTFVGPVWRFANGVKHQVS